MTAPRFATPAPDPFVDNGYTLRGGLHSSTANIANVLAHHGITAEGRPITEALVFGVGGGPGAGYILWEFKQHDARILVLAFRNLWQYPDRWTEKTLTRLGVRYAEEHTSGAARAARRLAAELASGRPCIIRPDPALMGYWHQPAWMAGHAGHDVVVYAEDAAGVHVDDRNLSPLLVSRDTLNAARARIGSFKNSLYVIDPTSGEVPLVALRAAVRDGLRDCVEHLGSSSDSFSLPAWRKWSRLMTDQKGAKAWPNVFADGKRVAGALLSIWEGVLPTGMDGGHLRSLYAAFLREAADLLGLDALHASAADFDAAAEAWEAVAAAALPDTIPPLARLRDLTAALRATVADPASTSPDEARQIADDLWQLRTSLNRAPFASPAEITDIFRAVGDAVAEVYARETAAVERLARVAID